MKKFIVSSFVVLSLAVVPLAGAQTPGQPAWMSSAVKEMVEKARAATKQVTIEELKAAIDSKEDIVILDVRNPDEYGVAHIPGALNVPRGLLEFVIWTAVPDKGKKIYVYCKTGARAALATKVLNEIGYTNAVAVNTGGLAWVKAGYPVKTSITDEELVLTPAK